jgi:hypothetical protein
MHDDLSQALRRAADDETAIPEAVRLLTRHGFINTSHQQGVDRMVEMLTRGHMNTHDIRTEASWVSDDAVFLAAVEQACDKAQARAAARMSRYTENRRKMRLRREREALESRLTADGDEDAKLMGDW